MHHRPIFVAMLSAMLFSGVVGTALHVHAQQTTSPGDIAKENLKRLEDILKGGEKFQTEKFRLLWAREAYRCGNVDGAFQSWEALALEGNVEASYILALFGEWFALDEDGSRAAQYALRLFRAGDGTADLCKIGASN